jgi:acetyl-CoA carboxylase biotin carboxylase subunit
MGDKVHARNRMIEAGVPVVPGTAPLPEDPRAAWEMVRAVGLPVMLKASAGGGGKGMRVVKEEHELASSLLAARSEAKKAFGDDQVYAERYLEEPHHIEIQVLADERGETVHLFERECSIQRRHQKVLEETPSPFVSREIVREMGEIAKSAARAVRYTGAGTVEFLVDKHRRFYFLEMNTRLQVEHPITEETCGLDLVKEQLRIASGEALGYAQKDIVQRGHAIEVRVCAEDPENSFLPSPGRITSARLPGGPGIRNDEGFYAGGEVTIYYDPLLAKLIARGDDRAQAIARMRRALAEYVVGGIRTNLGFLGAVLASPAFARGLYDTGFIEQYKDELFAGAPRLACEDAALVAAISARRAAARAALGNGAAASAPASRWKWADRR